MGTFQVPACFVFADVSLAKVGREPMPDSKGQTLDGMRYKILWLFFFFFELPQMLITNLNRLL